MTITATDEQVMKMCALAVNASVPMGLGWLHATSEEFTPEQFSKAVVGNSGCFLDYVQGRMVKLRMWRRAAGQWEIPDSLRLEYESWGSTYPTYAALAKAAGVEC